MGTPDLHEPAPRAPAIRSWARRPVLLAAGALVLVLATAGIVAALPRGSSAPPQPRAARVSLRPIAGGDRQPETAPGPHHASSSHDAPGAPGTSASPQAAPPSALPDGTYPAYVRGVDVGAGTISVDVVQVFEDEDAVRTAIEDGTPSDEAQYLYVHVRNQSGRLRTFRASPDVRIEFVGECETPPDREAALAELAARTARFDTAYYYDVSLADGMVHRIVQHLAVPAC